MSRWHMRFVLAAGFVLGLLSVGGCATVLDGTSQSMRINSSPRSAVCEAARQGEVLGSTSASSPVLQLTKSRHDILLTCSAPGYETASAVIPSSASSNGVASIFVFDLGITDYVTGALNKYPSAASVTLKPIEVDGAAMGNCSIGGSTIGMQNSDCVRLGGRPLS